MTGLFAILVVWTIAATAFGVLLGRFLHRTQQPPPRPEREPDR